MNTQAASWRELRERRCVVRVGLCLFFALGVPGPTHATDEIYRFIDERGIPHFSNAPSDSRYRLFLRSASAAGFDSTADAPAVILFAPPVVDRAKEFAVSVIFSSSAPVHGWLEIGFDPAALTLLAVGMDHESLQVGRVRLWWSSGQTAFSTDLHFMASPQAPEQTSIEVMEASLTTVNHRSILPSVAEATPIAISSLAR